MRNWPSPFDGPLTKSERVLFFTLTAISVVGVAFCLWGLFKSVL